MAFASQLRQSVFHFWTFSDDKTIVVQPVTQAGTQQKWFIDNEHIRLRSQENFAIGVASDAVHDGLQCSATEISENNCWIIDRQ